MYQQVGNVLKKVNMTNVKNIKDFKESKNAKLHVSHLQIILKIVNLTITGLAFYEVYVPVHTILSTLRQQKKILEIHLEHNKKLAKKRGNDG